MKYKLISFDLDGTFLTDEKTTPPENLEMLEKAAEPGVYIVPNSGRIFPGMPEELIKAEYIRYYLCGNGASVYDKKADKVIAKAEISPELALRFAEYMDTLPVVYDCYQDNMGYMTEEMYNALEDWAATPAMAKYMKRVRRPVPDLKKMLAEKNHTVMKMQMHFHDLEERRRQLEIIPQLFPELTATSSIMNNIEVNSVYSTKGHALETLCAHLGIDLSEVIAFGDGSNDISMIKAAGMGVAMENSEKSVLEAADMVAGNNNDSGMAKVIKKLIFF